MNATKLDIAGLVFDIHRDLSVTTRRRKPGPPERIDGMTVGIELVSRDAPHDGEVHPDGDEILVVVSGRMRVVFEAAPSESIELGPGEACVVPKGEWHKVNVLDPGQLIHITPGPRGDHRPLPR
jgi:mannose-6-phosphate isomerase-like protein (cupin superfamily)